MIGGREGGDHARARAAGWSRPQPRTAARKRRGRGERADDAELVPELEQDRARRVRRQKPVEASAQRRLEAVPGDQPLRLAGNDRAPDARGAPSTGWPAPSRTSPAIGRRTNGISGASARSPALNHAVTRDAERPATRRSARKPRRRSRRRSAGSAAARARSRAATSAPTASASKWRPRERSQATAGPDQEGEDDEAAVEVLGDDLDACGTPVRRTARRAQPTSAAMPIPTGIR